MLHQSREDFQAHQVNTFFCTNSVDLNFLRRGRLLPIFFTASRKDNDQFKDSETPLHFRVKGRKNFRVFSVEL